MDESYKTFTINDISMDIYENLSLGVAGEIWKCGLGFSSLIFYEKSKKYFKNKFFSRYEVVPEYVDYCCIIRF